MSTWKEERALRIMEALSGVDEKLLERSEETGKRKKNRNSRKYRRPGLMSRYGGLCAACLCLAVLGAAWWRFAGQDKLPGMENSTSDNGARDTALQAESCGGGETSSLVSPQESGAAEEDTGTQESGYRLEEPDWLDIDMLLQTASAEKLNQEIDNTQQTMQQSPEESPARVEEDAAIQNSPESLEDKCSVKEDAGAENAERISWETARAVSVLGSYVPEKLPEGYEFLAGQQSAEPRNSILLTWTNQEHILWLKLTETELTAEMLEGTEEAVFDAKEDWQSLIPAPAADGSIRFSLLYGDGVLVEYKGWLNVSETEELLGN